MRGKSVRCAARKLVLSAPLLLAVVLVLSAGCSQIGARFPKQEPLDRAIVLYESGKLLEARRVAATVTEEGPEHDAAQELIADIDDLRVRLIKRHIDLGKTYQSAGNYEQAQHEYDQAAKLNPDGDLNLEEKTAPPTAPETASLPAAQPTAVLLSLAGDRRGNNPLADINFRKARMYYQSGKYAKALEKLTTALRLAPAFVEARSLYEKTLRERDEVVAIYLKEGIQKFQQEEMEEAIVAWKTVLDLDPENRIAADYLARATVMMKRLSEIREQRNGQMHLN